MKKIFVVVFVLISCFAGSFCTVNAESFDKEKKYSYSDYSVDSGNWVLVFMNGSWWWVIFDEDGNIKNQIPADF